MAGKEPHTMTTHLRRERLARGLTLRELAFVLDCSHSAIFYLEKKGRATTPRPGLRLRLERYFGLPVEVLLAPDNENGPAPRSRAAEFATDAASPGAAEDGASS
jgi:transcriptional regulator with XRE-family HTH domain